MWAVKALKPVENERSYCALPKVRPSAGAGGVRAAGEGAGGSAGGVREASRRLEEEEEEYHFVANTRVGLIQGFVLANLLFLHISG